MVIECSDQCGIAEGSEAVTMLTTRAVDAKFDAPSVMYGSYAAAPFPTAAVPNFRKEQNQSADCGFWPAGVLRTLRGALNGECKTIPHHHIC